MMASPRQKSCNECVRSKRRCDLGLPACQLCIKRRVACVYPWVAELGKSISTSPAEMEAAAASMSMPRSDLNHPCAAASSFASHVNIGSNVLPFTPLESPASVPQPLSPTLFPFLDGMSNHEGYITSPQNLDHQLTTFLPISNVGQPQGNHVLTGSAYIPRTEYAARRLALQAQVLAQTGQTSFIHHTQVGASTALQEALAASALHAVRNGRNSAIIRMEISRRVRQLVDAVEKARSSPLVDIDLLHPVQALLIYQCMRLFATNDLVQQAQAESDEIQLQSWVEQLRMHTQPFGNSGGWQGWIRDESVRRAVVFTEFLSGVYSFLKFGSDTAHVRMMPLGFTAQAALWDAKSGAEWQNAWSTLPRLEVIIGNLDEDMGKATPSDFEELGVVIRATHGGLEAIEEWLEGDLTELRKWGLRD